VNNEEAENKELLEGTLDIKAAVRYLTIYLGEPVQGDWESHIGELYNRHKPKQEDIAAFMRNTISCAILMPLHDQVNTEHPENVLHKCPYWRQINERDWFADLRKIAAEDLDIMTNRAQMLSLGVIEPLAWQPYTRQAFNWLYAHSERAGCITEENKDVIRTRMSNLVYAYGGMVTCAVFEKSPDWVKRVNNWRTGYFFEKTIYKVFTAEEMYKIKKRELEKSDEKLVKSIRL
jgi:hypothetical protein